MEAQHIKYKERFNQFQNFSNIQFGKLRPIDIDGFLEIQNRLFIFLECKAGDSPLSTGQRIALERLSDAIEHDEEKLAFCIIARHNTPANMDVDAGNSLVDTYRHKGKWHFIADLEYTVHDFIQSLIHTYIGKNTIWICTLAEWHGNGGTGRLKHPKKES